MLKVLDYNYGHLQLASRSNNLFERFGIWNQISLMHSSLCSSLFFHCSLASFFSVMNWKSVYSWPRRAGADCLARGLPGNQATPDKESASGEIQQAETPVPGLCAGQHLHRNLSRKSLSGRGGHFQVFCSLFSYISTQLQQLLKVWQSLSVCPNESAHILIAIKRILIREESLFDMIFVFSICLPIVSIILTGLSCSCWNMFSATPTWSSCLSWSSWWTPTSEAACARSAGDLESLEGELVTVVTDQIKFQKQEGCQGTRRK